MKNNTELEAKAFGESINLSDAHCRISPNNPIRQVLGTLPSLVDRAAKIGEKKANEEFLTAFFEFHLVRVPSHCQISYSSSCLVTSVATVLNELVNQVVCEVPSFDNIRDLLRHGRFKIEIVSEGEVALLLSNSAAPRTKSAFWLARPNNPTGRSAVNSELLKLAEYCHNSGDVIVIDSSFRSFSKSRWNIDYLALFSEFSQLSWIIIEDTGKFLPTNDIKAGIVYSSPGIAPLIAKANSELLLNVSPALLLLLAKCYENIDRKKYIDRIERNRLIILDALAGFQSLVLPRSLSEDAPLVWMEGRGENFGMELYERLKVRGTHILPGAAFFENSGAGGRFARIALNRDQRVIREGAGILSEVLSTWKP